MSKNITLNINNAKSTIETIQFKTATITKDEKVNAQYSLAKRRTSLSRQNRKDAATSYRFGSVLHQRRRLVLYLTWKRNLISLVLNILRILTIT